MKINNKAISLSSFNGHARQGDTLLRRVNDIPVQLKQTKNCTLALGEKTGHHHTFETGAIGFADEETALADFVEVTTPKAPVVHQEHDPIIYPKGKYESLKQVEYTPEALKPVTD